MLPTNKPYLIGETAFHHEGDVAFLKELIDEASKVGVDAMKFHLTIDLDDYMVANHEALEILRPWCLNADQWSEILPYVLDKNMDLILLCNDVKSLQWVNKSDLKVAAIELHATGLNDYFLLEEAVSFAHTVILGSGGSTIDEIQYAIEFLKAKGKDDIFLMHGFQNYPTDFKDINLSKMNLLSDLFKVPIGYADHTDPNDEDNAAISVLAAGMGFNVLEKHFTHKFGVKRIDSQAAVSLEQMVSIRRLIDKACLTFGSGKITMSESELKYGNTGPMKKAIVARKAIAEGEVIKLEHIAFKRTNESTQLQQLELPKLLGMKAQKNIKKDEPIDFSKVEFIFQVSDISQFKNA